MDSASAVLALLAAIMFALSATLWQRAGLNLGEVSIRRPATFLALFAQGVWMLGLAAQAGGVVLQGAALDRGRLAIVQPLLVTSVIFAMPLGYWLTGQEVTRRQVAGASVIVVGLAAFAVFGDPAGGVDDAPTSEWLIAFAIVGVVCAAVFALTANRGGAKGKAAAYGIVAGMLYGVSATLMKPVVESMHSEGWGVLEDWQFWMLCATGLVGFLLQQVSLSTGALVTSVATVSVANPVVSITLGVVVLEERLARPAWHIVVALVGLAVALGGVVAVASAREGSQARATT